MRGRRGGWNASSGRLLVQITGRARRSRRVSRRSGFMAKNDVAGKKLIFRSARIFDGDSDALIEGKDVVVADGAIEDVMATDPRGDKDAEVVDCRGRVLMP